MCHAMRQIASGVGQGMIRERFAFLAVGILKTDYDER